MSIFLAKLKLYNNTKGNDTIDTIRGRFYINARIVDGELVHDELKSLTLFDFIVDVRACKFTEMKYRGLDSIPLSKYSIDEEKYLNLYNIVAERINYIVNKLDLRTIFADVRKSKSFLEVGLDFSDRELYQIKDNIRRLSLNASEKESSAKLLMSCYISYNGLLVCTIDKTNKPFYDTIARYDIDPKDRSIVNSYVYTHTNFTIDEYLKVRILDIINRDIEKISIDGEIDTKVISSVVHTINIKNGEVIVNE